MDKASLRKETIQAMRALSVEEKKAYDKSLLRAFIDSPAYQQAATLATYLNMGHEFSTAPLIEQALSDGKRVLIPKTYPQGRMIFVEYDPEGLQATKFGLMEPVSQEAVDKSHIDLIHVPGVVFQEDGYRIGYGAGYYDRYLADYQGATQSTVYPVQAGHFQPQSHDVAVKEVLYGRLD